MMRWLKRGRTGILSVYQNFHWIHNRMLRSDFCYILQALLFCWFGTNVLSGICIMRFQFKVSFNKLVLLRLVGSTHCNLSSLFCINVFI